jgi:hypothetical protein
MIEAPADLDAWSKMRLKTRDGEAKESGERLAIRRAPGSK